MHVTAMHAQMGAMQLLTPVASVPEIFKAPAIHTGAPCGQGAGPDGTGELPRD